MALFTIRPTGTIWDDGSDGTSVVLYDPDLSGSTPNQVSHPLPATAIAGTVVRAQVFVRGRTLTGAEGGWSGLLVGPNGGFGIGNPVERANYTRLGESFGWASNTLDGEDVYSNFDVALADLAAGESSLLIQATDAVSFTFHSDVEISEAYLEIETAATVAPPCRLYPRTDLLGNSPRIYPPPKSQQYGNRRAGGYY